MVRRDALAMSGGAEGATGSEAVNSQAKGSWSDGPLESPLRADTEGLNFSGNRTEGLSDP